MNKLIYKVLGILIASSVTSVIFTSCSNKTNAIDSNGNNYSSLELNENKNNTGTSVHPLESKENEGETTEPNDNENTPEISVQPPESSENESDPTDSNDIENTPEIPVQPPESSEYDTANSNENNDSDAQLILYADVGDRYNTVMQPIRDLAEYIIADLTENGIIIISDGAIMTSIRYFYGRSLDISFKKKVKIFGTQTENEFLYVRSSIYLENFSGTNEDWREYANFLKTERESEGLSDYEAIVLPLAKQTADNLKANYEEYKAQTHFSEIRAAQNSTTINLKSNSYLAETYTKIASKLNEVIAEKNLPLITNQDIEITFAGNIYQEVVYTTLQLQIVFQNFHYWFDLPFNSDGKFTEDWINHYKDELKTGYVSTSGLEALTVPYNEEYAEFFGELKIEEKDFSSAVMHTYILENTFIDF